MTLLVGNYQHKISLNEMYYLDNILHLQVVILDNLNIIEYGIIIYLEHFIILLFKYDLPE